MNAGPSRLQQVIGLVVLMALFLPLLWLRVGNEKTLWIDELHSLQLSQLPVERLLDESARDFHPPGHPLALKLWLKIGRMLGLDPGLAWARALNVAAWIVFVATTWLLGAFLLGPRHGFLLTACIAASAAASVVVHDVRSYAFASGALLLGVLFLVALRGLTRSGSRVALLSIGCAAALTAALWSHLLAAPAVVFLGATWLAVVLATKQGSKEWPLRAGLLAQLAPWVLFLPWLLEIPEQVAHLRQVSPDWMTPASWGNLLRVFTWWLPLGRIGAPSPSTALGLTALGTLAVLVPLVVGARGARVRRPPSSAAGSLALLALPTSVGCILLFWTLSRLDLAATFHGPRYPLLLWGVFAAGLVAAAIAGSRRFAHAVAAMSLWLLAGVVGQVLAIQQESSPAGLADFERQIEELAPAPGSPLYVMPSELAPFVRDHFPHLDLHRIEDLVCSPPDDGVVLGINPWPALDRTRDQVISHAIHTGLLAAGVERRASDAQGTAVAYRLTGVDKGVALEICGRGMRPLATAPQTAISSAVPEDQLAGDGWSYLELDEQLDARRWATRPEVRIRFDRPVPSGDYLLHLRGVRQPYPGDDVELSVQLEGSSFDQEVPLGPGPFELTFHVTLDRSGRPILLVGHPTWSPATAIGSSDERQLSFLFDAAWLSE